MKIKQLSILAAVFITSLSTFLIAEVCTTPPADFKPRFEVAACFLENDGRILLLHRLERTSQGNTWGIPGGKIEKGETPISAVLREVKEETGIALNQDSIKPIMTLYITNTVRNKVSYVYHMFRASYTGNLAIQIDPNGHKGFTWVTPSDALTMQLMDDEPECIRMTYPTQIGTGG